MTDTKMEQIPSLKVNKTLIIPNGETSERSPKSEETGLKWNSTENDFDIYHDGKWELYTNIIKFNKELIDRRVESLEKSDKSTYIGQLATLEYIAEQNRMRGQSGVLSTRQYTTNGTESYLSTTSVGYAPLSGHVHWNFKDLIGMGEWSGMANGYYFRTRHNDYHLNQTAPKGSKFLEVNPVIHPKTPKDVLRQKTPQLQMDVARQYFKVLMQEAPVNSVEDYKSAFQWVMSYAEVFFEVIKPDGELKDTFSSDRHQIDAKKVIEVLKKNNYFSYGGHKNRFENIPFVHVTVGDVDPDTGYPDIVLLRHRISTYPVGSLQSYPIEKVVSYYGDSTTARRVNLNHDELAKNRKARFRVNDSTGNDSDYNNYGRSLIDTFMEKIPGLDGKGANLTEEYLQYGHQDKLTKYGTRTTLNAAYYSRYYSMLNDDASSRRNAKRGFHDDKLWVAKTTRKEVLQRKYDTHSYGFSYAIPLELFIDSFLDDFNPHQAINGDALGLKSYSYYRKGYGTTSKPYPGYFARGSYYHTPSEFYAGNLTDGDDADTGIGGYWVKCKDGKIRQHYASGMPYVLPPINGVNKRVRVRFPIYAAHEEGSYEFKQIEALRADFNEHLAKIASKEFAKQIEIYNYENK
jgi:hypothetical protein